MDPREISANSNRVSTLLINTWLSEIEKHNRHSRNSVKSRACLIAFLVLGLMAYAFIFLFDRPTFNLLQESQYFLLPLVLCFIGFSITANIERESHLQIENIQAILRRLRSAHIDAKKFHDLLADGADYALYLWSFESSSKIVKRSSGMSSRPSGAPSVLLEGLDFGDNSRSHVLRYLQNLIPTVYINCERDRSILNSGICIYCDSNWKSVFRILSSNAKTIFVDLSNESNSEDISHGLRYELAELSNAGKKNVMLLAHNEKIFEKISKEFPRLNASEIKCASSKGGLHIDHSIVDSIL